MAVLAAKAGRGSDARAAMLLLVVAVVVAGALPSGAQAQLNISNTCNQNITLSTGAGSVSVGAGTVQSLVSTAQAFLTGPVSVSVLGTAVPLPLSSIPIPTSLITSLLAGALNVTQITVSCSSPNCVTLTATGTLALLGLPLGIPYSTSVGPVCAPALP